MDRLLQLISDIMSFILPEPSTRCAAKDDGKHVYDPYCQHHGFDSCIWCGQRRPKGWCE